MVPSFSRDTEALLRGAQVGSAGSGEPTSIWLLPPARKRLLRSTKTRGLHMKVILKATTSYSRYSLRVNILMLILGVNLGIMV